MQAPGLPGLWHNEPTLPLEASLTRADLTPTYLQSFIEEDSSLWTLKRLDIADVCRKMEELGYLDSVRTEDQLYEALLDVMYKTRPTGPM